MTDKEWNTAVIVGGIIALIIALVIGTIVINTECKPHMEHCYQRVQR